MNETERYSQELIEQLGQTERVASWCDEEETIITTAIAEGRFHVAAVLSEQRALTTGQEHAAHHRAMAKEIRYAYDYAQELLGGNLQGQNPLEIPETLEDERYRRLMEVQHELEVQCARYIPPPARGGYEYRKYSFENLEKIRTALGWDGLEVHNAVSDLLDPKSVLEPASAFTVEKRREALETKLAMIMTIRPEQLPFTGMRRAEPTEHRKWLVNTLEKGRDPNQVSEELKFRQDETYVATRDIILPPLFGAHSIKLIVPEGISIYGSPEIPYHHIGHSTLLLPDGKTTSVGLPFEKS